MFSWAIRFRLMLLGHTGSQQTRKACHTQNKLLDVPHYPTRTFANIFYFFFVLNWKRTLVVCESSPTQGQQQPNPNLLVPCCFWDATRKSSILLMLCSYYYLFIFVCVFWTKKMHFLSTVFSHPCLWISWITSIFGLRGSSVLCFPYIVKAMQIRVTSKSSTVYT